MDILRVAEIFRLARIGRGWSQDQLAHATGLTQASISRIENGEQIELKTLIRIFEVITEEDGKE